MKNSDPRRKKLQLGLREARSLLRRTRSSTIRRECRTVVKISNNCLKISKSYEEELSSLREKNLNLARAVQKEKENFTFLLQEKNASDSCLQNVQKENAYLKKDSQQLEKVIFKYDEDLKNSMIPNLVKLSDDITQFKFNNDIIKKVIESRGNGDAGLPRNTWLNGNSWANGVNFTSNTNQPVSTVNPMVKGYIIQKPTINVRRVSIPNDNRPSLFANVEIASPILEEPEDELETVTSRNRKCKNGLRHVINISNAPVGSSIPSVTVPEIGFRSRPSEFSDDIDFRMEPVVRLSDVTRLLQNSSYRISEPTSGSPALPKCYSSPHENFTPEIVLKRCKTPKPSDYENESDDNPLEGCSWMYRSSPSSHYERTSSRVSPATQPHDHSRTKTDHNGSNLDKSNRNSTKKEDTPGKVHEYVEKRESLFRPRSLANSDFVTKRKESCYPRASTATLNESSAPVRETTFLSSTLNSAKKKKFFSNDEESSVFFTTRRRLPRSPESIVKLSPPTENSCLTKPKDNVESRCSSDSKTLVEVSTSNIPDDGPETKKSLRKSNRRKSKRRSTTSMKKKETKPRSAPNDENFSPIQISVLSKSIRTGTLSIRLNDCMTSTRKLSTRKKSVVRKTKSISYDSDSSYSAVSSTQSPSSSDDSSLTVRRSGRTKQSVSYKEPDLGRKLRR